MNIVYTVLALVIGFSLLVIVHEFGHYITAKLFHTKMEEFSVGMGPKIASKKLTNIELSLRAIPIGGYVRFTDPEADIEQGKTTDVDPKDPHLLPNLSIWKRLIVYSAGAVMNLVLGFVLLVIVYLSMGLPTNQMAVGSVIPDTPAEKAGLMANDIIIRVDGNEITQENYAESVEQISALIGSDKVIFTVLRNGKEVDLELQPEYSEEDKGYKVGFYFGYIYTAMPFGTALQYSWEASKNMMTLLYDSLSRMITKGEGLEDLSGPIGVVQVVNDATKEGLLDVIAIFIALSFNLAVINMLPLPALDGGKVLLLILEAIRRKPLKRETEGVINLVGFALLMLLTVAISIKDVIGLHL